MEWLLFIVLWGVLGTFIGRVLFAKRLADIPRYEIAERNDYHRQIEKGDLLHSHGMASAQTYGLWSIPFWPLTLAIFVVQLPTKAEREITEREKAKALMAEFDLK